jgi:hypothetical protein
VCFFTQVRHRSGLRLPGAELQLPPPLLLLLLLLLPFLLQITPHTFILLYNRSAEIGL